MQTRRKFLRVGSLLLPSAFVASRAMGQGLTFNDLPFFAKAPLSGCSAAANTAVAAWVTQVGVNGGAAPSQNTQNALCAFYDSLVGASLLTKMVHINAIVPDNLIAALTPFYVKVQSGSGLSLWANTGFVSGDLTVNGLLGNGTSKWANSGVDGGSATTSGGARVALTIYVYTATNNANARDFGSLDIATTNLALALTGSLNSKSTFESFHYVPAGSVASATNASWTGYLTGSRVATTDARLFIANSGVPHAQLGATAANSETQPTSQQLYAFAANTCFTANCAGAASNFSDRRISYFSVEDGLSLADSAAYYPIVQALRVALGGGFV